MLMKQLLKSILRRFQKPVYRLARELVDFYEYSGYYGNIDLHTMMTLAERKTLESIVARKKPEVAVEIGSWKGASTTIIARHSGVVYAIDPFTGAPDSWEVHSAARHDVLKVFRNNLRIMGISNVIPIVGKSADVFNVFGRCVDFVFIDGDHTRPGILADLRWREKLRFGGVICGHDAETYYSELPEELRMEVKKSTADYLVDRGLHPGVIYALYTVFHDEHMIEPGTSIWWCQC